MFCVKLWTDEAGKVGVSTWTRDGGTFDLVPAWFDTADEAIDHSNEFINRAERREHTHA